jgi:hypothetical protein
VGAGDGPGRSVSASPRDQLHAVAPLRPDAPPKLAAAVAAALSS